MSKIIHLEEREKQINSERNLNVNEKVHWHCYSIPPRWENGERILGWYIEYTITKEEDQKIEDWEE